jgi:hypothetical protein
VKSAISVSVPPLARSAAEIWAIGEIEGPDDLPTDITRLDPAGRPVIGPIEVSRV